MFAPANEDEGAHVAQFLPRVFDVIELVLQLYDLERKDTIGTLGS